ncbi:hypothetical protein A6R68_06368 [Neotoma lepida]|uniref:Transcriptional regulator ATRX n=1 Tax=Neotoma lepida TaxID=56216 RepID=A0A1A6GFT1_NEOLE|nr:hypothetical protein A6R68_06368 [Neotoma lepida]
MLSRIWTHPWCLQLDYISKENKGYFDEDSMDEFIASDSDETSMSLSSDEYAKKKKTKGKKGKKDSSSSGSGSDNDVEVIKVWNSRSRGGGEGNVDETGNTPSGSMKLDESEGKWLRNIDYYRLDGSTTAQSRKKWAEEFNDETNGTMEDKIYDRQVTKQSLSFRVVDQQQVERHFTMNELTELYTFEPDLLDDPNSEKKKKRDTPMLPKVCVFRLLG